MIVTLSEEEIQEVLISHLNAKFPQWDVESSSFVVFEGDDGDEAGYNDINLRSVMTAQKEKA